MRTAYDPFNREEELEAEQAVLAREEHQLWSLDQARKGQSAAQRDNIGVWLAKTKLPDDEPPVSNREELAAWAQ